MKIKRRVISLFLLFAMLGTVCVSAKTAITRIDYDGSNVAVTVTADGGEGTRLSFRVRKEGSTGLADAAALLEQSLDSNGQTVFRFVMPDEKDGAATDGNYVITVKASQEEAVAETIHFVSAANRKAALQALRDCENAAAVGSVLEESRDALTIIGVKLDLYDRLNQTGKNDFLSTLFSQLPGCTNEEQLKKVSDRELARATINHGDSDEVEEALYAANPAYEGTAYEDIQNSELKNWIDELIYANRTYADYSALENQYEAANVYYVVNHVRAGDLEEVLAQKATQLGLKGTKAYTDYQALSAGKKLQAASEFLRLTSTKPIRSNEDMQTILAQAVAAVPNTGNGGGNNGGGSSGGSGGSGGGGGSSKPSGVGSNSGIKSNTNIAGVNGTSENDTTPLGNSFWDLENAVWAADAINALAKRGILNGVGDGRFEPDRTVTREEFAKILTLACNYELSSEPTEFADVDSKLWYAPYVATLVQAGVVQGIGGTDLFGVGMELSRQDLAVLLYRIKGDSLTAVREWNEFMDYDAAGSYAKEAIRVLYCAGCIDGMGDGTFRPEASCTRAEAAKMVYQILGIGKEAE